MILVQHNVSITNKEHFEQSSSRAGKSPLSADPEPHQSKYPAPQRRPLLNHFICQSHTNTAESMCRNIVMATLITVIPAIQQHS